MGNLQPHLCTRLECRGEKGLGSKRGGQNRRWKPYAVLNHILATSVTLLVPKTYQLSTVPLDPSSVWTGEGGSAERATTYPP